MINGGTILGGIGLLLIIINLYYYYLPNTNKPNNQNNQYKRINLPNKQYNTNNNTDINTNNKIPSNILDIFQEHSLSANSGLRIGDINPKIFYHTLL